MNEKTIQQLSELLHEVAEAHHQAFIETDGADPDWPLWYGDHMLEKTRDILGASFTKSEVVYLLVSADKEQALRAPGANWTKYYAKYFVERYL
jgi:hypothetical protein